MLPLKAFVSAADFSALPKPVLTRIPAKSTLLGDKVQRLVFAFDGQRPRLSKNDVTSDGPTFDHSCSDLPGQSARRLWS